MRIKALLAACIAGIACVAPAEASATVVGSGTPASCTSAAVVAAVRNGGLIRFSCGSRPVTIPMTRTAKVLNTSARVVIDGGGRVTLSGRGVRRILYMNTCDPAQKWTTPHCSQQKTPRLVIENLTFENGDSVGDGAAGGGAIFAFGGGLRIVHSAFRENRCAPASGPAVGGGAVEAVWQDDAQPARIIDSTFTDNTCENPGPGGGGGAVFESQGELAVRDSTFTGNRCVTTGPDVGGGAIRVFMGRGVSAPVRIAGSRFIRNSCSNGAALSSIAASWRIMRSSFLDNHAVGIGANPAAAGTPGGGSGGAIYNDGDRMRLSISGSRFEGNTAREGGGAVFFVSDDRTGTMSIAASQMAANISDGFQTPGLPGIFFLGARSPEIVGSTLKVGPIVGRPDRRRRRP